jgi:hypothetical protein
MKKFVLFVIGLLALFTILRVQAGGQLDEGEANRYLVHPGLIEIQGEEQGVRIAFGLLERSGDGGALWDVLPLNVNVRSGSKRFSLGMSGLSLLTRRGVSVGRPLIIEGEHQGDVVSVGGEVTVRGRVAGDVWSLGSDIILEKNASVAGDVVALGGEIEAARGAYIRGDKQSMPAVKIPFVGLLASNRSAAVFRLLIAAAGILLYLLLLLLFCQFGGRHLPALSRALAAQWRGALLSLLATLLAVPVLALLLTVSVVGVMLLPLLFVLVIVLAYAGFIGATLWLGEGLLGKKSQAVPRLYAAAVVGFLIIKLPLLLGLIGALFSPAALQTVGRVLAAVGTGLTVLAALYGLGGAVNFLRIRARGAA